MSQLVNPIEDIVDDLRLVKEVLSPRGAWTRHSSARTHNRQRSSFRSTAAKAYCLGGALNLVLCERRGGAVRTGEDWLTQLGFEKLSELWAWNDQPKRRKDQVTRLVEKAVLLNETVRGTEFSSKINIDPPERLNSKNRQWSDIHIVLEDPEIRRLTGQQPIGRSDEVYMCWWPANGSRARGRLATVRQARTWCARWVLHGDEPPTLEELNEDKESANYAYREGLNEQSK